MQRKEKQELLQRLAEALEEREQVNADIRVMREWLLRDISVPPPVRIPVEGGRILVIIWSARLHVDY